MRYQEVFAWAEDKSGMMVYVDDVPGGAACNCVCPACHESLIARHGSERAHGFAHESQKRGANLNICMKVIMFKLAEQIIKTEKKIYSPSYYGIFKSGVIEFETLEINGCFEREDRQPDVIGTTKEHQKYLIEFSLGDDVRHRKKIDYENLNCLEIDLTGQRINDRNSLKEFLLKSDSNRRWLNNDTYFNFIEKLYKNIRLAADEECRKCPVRRSCCAVKEKNDKYVYADDYLLINQNDKQYRLCNREEYKEKIDEYNRENENNRICREQNLKRYHDILQQRNNHVVNKNISDFETIGKNEMIQQNISHHDGAVNKTERSCFDCKNNLQWANKNGYANCGCHESLRLPQQNGPTAAKKLTER